MIHTKKLRGQVWLWNDPVYKYKRDGISIPHGEIGVRYSRFVLVMQNEMNTSESVLAVPCTSKRKLDTDMEISIPNNDGIPTYVRPSAIFPVSLDMLHHYVTSIPDDVVNQVENIIKDLISSNKKESIVEGPEELNEFPNAVSKIANLIRHSLQRDDLYGRMSINTKNKLYPEDFYDQIGNSLYYSLIEYFDMKLYKGVIKVPNTDSIEDKLDMAHLMLYLYFNTTEEGLGEDLLLKYQKEFGENYGLDYEWSCNLCDKLTTKLKWIEKEDIQNIIGTIRSKYC